MKSGVRLRDDALAITDITAIVIVVVVVLLRPLFYAQRQLAAWAPAAVPFYVNVAG